LIEKSLRPKVVLGNESLLHGWSYVLENRDSWLQGLRIEGHLENQSMLLASAKTVAKDIGHPLSEFSLLTIDEDRTWKIHDITPEIIQQFIDFDSANINNSKIIIPPLFCIVTYLRLYDEIHNGDKDWRVVFNFLRFMKYSLGSTNANAMAVVLLASLKVDEIYSLKIKENYKNSMEWQIMH